MAKGYMKYGYSRGPAKPKYGKPKAEKGDPFGPMIAKSKGPRKPKGFVATPKGPSKMGVVEKPMAVQYGQAGNQMSVGNPSYIKPMIAQQKEVGIRKPMETMYRGPAQGGIGYKRQPVVKQGVDDGYYIDGFRKRGGWMNRLLNMMTGGR
jgi:hypothetical protein